MLVLSCRVSVMDCFDVHRFPAAQFKCCFPSRSLEFYNVCRLMDKGQCVLYLLLQFTIHNSPKPFELQQTIDFSIPIKTIEEATTAHIQAISIQYPFSSPLPFRILFSVFFCKEQELLLVIDSTFSTMKLVSLSFNLTEKHRFDR